MQNLSKSFDVKGCPHMNTPMRACVLTTADTKIIAEATVLSGLLPRVQIRIFLLSVDELIELGLTYISQISKIKVMSLRS